MPEHSGVDRVTIKLWGAGGAGAVSPDHNSTSSFQGRICAMNIILCAGKRPTVIRCVAAEKLSYLKALIRASGASHGTMVPALVSSENCFTV